MIPKSQISLNNVNHVWFRCLLICIRWGNAHRYWSIILTIVGDVLVDIMQCAPWYNVSFGNCSRIILINFCISKFDEPYNVHLKYLRSMTKIVKTGEMFWLDFTNWQADLSIPSVHLLPETISKNDAISFKSVSKSKSWLTAISRS